MNKNLILTGVLLGFSITSAVAVCPSNISGGYSGYQTKYEGKNTVSNIINKVRVINFGKNGRAKVLANAKTSLAEPIGVQIGTVGDDKSYSYDKSTCVLRMWDPLIGSTASDEYFVVGDSGKTLYGLAQDVGNNETRTNVLTKQ